MKVEEFKRILALPGWKHLSPPPPMNEWVWLRGSDYTGDILWKARRIPKGNKRGYSWEYANGETDNEKPDQWRELE